MGRQAAYPASVINKVSMLVATRPGKIADIRRNMTVEWLNDSEFIIRFKPNPRGGDKK